MGQLPVTGPPDRPARRGQRRRDDDDPVLPDTTRDESDVGWGTDSWAPRERDDDWYRRERPPHHE